MGDGFCASLPSEWVIEPLRSVTIFVSIAMGRFVAINSAANTMKSSIHALRGKGGGADDQSDQAWDQAEPPILLFGDVGVILVEFVIRQKVKI